uniref:histidine kinase n=1 Tax=Oscillatoriales cyanobacterium SpSt-402 TaxID=2282168 RepID=A0A832H1B2_9CYAN
MESICFETILIIDDTPDNLRLLAFALTQKGYHVSIATSGAMALARIEDIMPDLILLDIRMPSMDGYEVCHELKNNPLTRTIPVLFISAIHETTDKVRAFGLGGADFITKPIQLEETLARIEHQLQIRRLQRQLEEQNIQLHQEVAQRRQAEQTLEQLNAELEQRVRDRTTQLELAYNFAATLQRISDHVRSSLDERQILQTAVQELAQTLGVENCNAGLYDLNQQTSTVSYEYTVTATTFQGRVLQMNNFAEGYRQLLQGQYFQFCSLFPHPLRGRVTLLTCPIIDNEAVLGDLWLVSESNHTFNQQDVWLVQQVANQCAIALRQARLFQSAQAQVQELEKLNHLKDDFLSTISHELRTPMSNIRLATQMLEIVLRRSKLFGEEDASRYFKILNDECEREIHLINDLLDLSRLDSGTEPLLPTTANLEDWIPCVAESFEERTRIQQQTLQLEMAADLCPFTTDFSYLERILTELLQNACKYTPAGGTIIVSAQPTESGVTLKVCNSGIEIPASELAKIFDKFYRVPTNDPWKHGGTGLGLALVKKRVEQLSGTISVLSENGQITFTVEIPQMSI